MQTSTIKPIAVMETAIKTVSKKIDLQSYDLHWESVKCNCGTVFFLYAKRPYTRTGDEKRCTSDLKNYLVKEDKAGKAHQEVYEINGKSTHATFFHRLHVGIID